MNSSTRRPITVREHVYEAALWGSRPVLHLAAPFHDKLGRGLSGRRRAVPALEAWAAAAREAARPLVWVHAPSVGESLMAQAIVAELRGQRPDLQIAFTYFSPSADRIAPRVGADVHGYLPWDLGSEARRACDVLQPAAIVFVRTEIWPVLSVEAVARGVRLLLVNAVLSAGSGRLGWASRFLLSPAYGRLDAVGAVAAEDGERFGLLGVPADRVTVTGDARFDQVWQRVRQLGSVPAAVGSASRSAQAPAGRGQVAAEVRARAALLERLRDDAVTTVVAGSTWPADDDRLVPAFANVVGRSPYRLIIAPHEPDAAHLERVERSLTAAGISHARLAAVEATAGELPQAVLVDRVGVLADLYSVGQVAYVGGGFHAAGLHSVVEPAALALPVLFGPRHGNAREAAELVAAGGGHVVRDAAGLAAQLQVLVQDAVELRRAGERALGFVRSRLGGAARNAALILDVLRRDGHDPGARVTITG